jgi:hypothetical protein
MKINLLSAVSWWAELGGLRQAMFIIGCCTGAVLILQIIMTLVGLGHDASFDASDGSMDADGDSFNDGAGTGIFGMKLLSLRAIVAFLGIWSWVTFILCDKNIGLPLWAGIVLGVVAGFAAMCLMAWALMAIEKLQSNGNVSIENSVGKTGEVYLIIPASRAAQGKIQITLQERLREYNAVTDAGRTIKTGEKIKVVSVVDDDTVVVEPFGETD